jgi:hypothetical protein
LDFFLKVGPSAMLALLLKGQRPKTKGQRPKT